MLFSWVVQHVHRSSLKWQLKAFTKRPRGMAKHARRQGCGGGLAVCTIKSRSNLETFIVRVYQHVHVHLQCVVTTRTQSLRRRRLGGPGRRFSTSQFDSQMRTGAPLGTPSPATNGVPVCILLHWAGALSFLPKACPSWSGWYAGRAVM